MAVTHADLAPSCRGTDLGSKTGAILMVISILFGLICFILSLISEASRSQVTWASTTDAGGDGKTYECTYSGSGKMPLLCAAGAFLALAIAMVVEHTYMLVAISNSTTLMTWDPDSDPAKYFTRQAAFFFITTWICFAVGEILLLIGISVESGHLKNWSTPNSSCLIVRQGVYSAAGVFGLTTVFLASGLYITALRAQQLLQDQENVRREVIEVSVLYASPPRSPRNRLATVRNEGPMIRQSNEQELSIHISAFDKHINLVYRNKFGTIHIMQYGSKICIQHLQNRFVELVNRASLNSNNLFCRNG